MVKKSKRILSLFLAVMMAFSVFTVVPFSASAATSLSLNPAAFGVVRGPNSNSRLNGNIINIVNDGGNDNTDAGLWKFNLTDIPRNASIDSASVTFTIDSVAKDTLSGQAIDFYYIKAIGGTADNYLNGASNEVSWGYGNDGIKNYKNNLGLSGTNFIGTLAHNGLSAGRTITLSLTEAIIYARNNGWTAIAIVAIQRAVNDSNNGWSDIHLRQPAVNIEYTSASATGNMQELRTAVTAFETKVGNGKLYTNIKPAYDAYVIANRYIDAVDYGEANINSFTIQVATENLISATADMKEWTYRTANETQAADFSYNTGSLVSYAVDGVNYQDNMTNVLYSYGVSGSAPEQEIVRNSNWIGANVNSHVIYGTVVFLYDGQKTPSTPISLYVGRGSWADGCGSMYTTESGLGLNKYWHGRINDAGTSGYCTNNNNQVTTDGTDNKGYSGNSTLGRDDLFSNTLYYTGDNSNFNNYLRTYSTVSWTGKNREQKAGTATFDSKIYVIDYKSLRDKIDTAKNDVLSNIKKYKEGGASALLGALDNATAFDPNNYAYQPSTTSNVKELYSGPKECADRIGELVSGLNTAKTEDLYNSLREEIDDSRNDYKNLESLYSQYTTKSVDDFMKAYEAAQSHMADLVTQPYSTNTDSNAAPKILDTNLRETHHNLDTLADLTPLIDAYNEVDEFLTSLDGLPAMYQASPLNELIAAITTESVQKYYNSDAAARSNFGQADQVTIEQLAQQVTAAFNKFKSSNTGLDLSAFQEAVKRSQYLDKDIYTEEASKEAEKAIAGITSDKINYNSAVISALKSDLTDKEITEYTSSILTALNRCIKAYDIATSGVTSVNGTGGNISDLIDGKCTASYGTKATFNAASSETAWYMSYQSNDTNRAMEFQGEGAQFTINVLGSLNIEAHSRSEETPNRVAITRKYDVASQPDALELVDYVADTYTLPTARMVGSYAFTGYTVNGETKAAGEIITLTGDTNISANYQYTGSEYTVTVTGNDNEVSGTYNYNDKIKLSAADDKDIWLQKVQVAGKPDSYRVFYYGSDCTLLVAESIELVAVTEAELGNYNITQQPISLRSETLFVEGKRVFNGQYQEPKGAILKERGVLVGKAVTGHSISADDVILENIDLHNDEYKLIRCKSTKPVGANQFTIRVGGLNDMADVIYKGYIIYQVGDEIITVYTDAMYK